MDPALLSAIGSPIAAVIVLILAPRLTARWQAADAASSAEKERVAISWTRAFAGYEIALDEAHRGQVVLQARLDKVVERLDVTERALADMSADLRRKEEWLHALRGYVHRMRRAMRDANLDPPPLDRVSADALAERDP